MSDKIVVLSVDELKDVLGEMIRSELENVLKAMNDCHHGDDEDKKLRGALEIADAMNISRTTFFERFKEDMERKGYIKWIGRTMHSTTGKVREYTREYC